LLLLAALLAAAAASVASLALFALALALAILIAFAGIVVAAAARRLTVSRTISEPEVQEGDAIHVRFDIRGIKWLPVRLEAKHQSGTWVGLGQAGGDVELTVSRRGAYWLEPSRLRVRDVLGVCEMPLRAGQAEPLLILPAPDVPAEVGSRHGASADDPEPDGVHAYVHGAPLGHIHWPALARGAGLQVRRFALARGSLPLVVVDTDGARNSLALDWTARRAAGHVLALARGDGCRVLLPGDASETTVTAPDAEWRAVHRRLATLEASGVSLPAPLARHGSTVHIRASAAPGSATSVRVRQLPPGVVAVTTESSEAGI
jgi:uncharacterized protein (DUF58 family)